MKITVLYGGESPEREISLLSGMTAAKALLTLGHKVNLTDTVKKPLPSFAENESALQAMHCALLADKCVCPPLHPQIPDFLRGCELVFPVLHGGIGEDGRLQAMLECFSVPFVGSSALACALAMDKVRCKEIYEKNGILTPLYTVYKEGARRPAIPPRYPCAVKPSNGGSSIGVTFVHSPLALEKAIDKARAVCPTVLMEELIVGTELSVSVLCDRPLAVTEIIPKNRYYDFESKYKESGAREITPAPLDKEIYQKALDIAYNAHCALGMHNFSRTDILLSKSDGLLYALETNAIPGLTPTSILPSAASSRGLSVSALIEKMLL